MAIMQKKGFLAVFAAILIAINLAWIGSLFWGILSPEPLYNENFLIEYDKIVGKGSESCFVLGVGSNYENKSIVPFTAIANGKVIARSEIDLSKAPLQVRECASAEVLALGDNLIDITVGANRVFYHATLVEEVEKKPPSILLTAREGEKVRLEITGNDDTVYAPVEIFVNGNPDHKLYFSGESFESKESLELNEGRNNVSAKFKGAEATIEVEKQGRFAMHPLIGTLLISVLLFALAFMVFASHKPLEKIAYSILSMLSIIMAGFFLLEISGMLSAVNFTVFVAATTAAITGVFGKRLGKNKGIDFKGAAEKARQASPLLAMLLIIFIFSSFFFNFFTDSYYSSWTVFYERQSRTITELEQVPFTDSFSFLGTKPFGYISGYFFLNSGVSMITGLSTQQSYAILMLLAQAAFLATMLLFFRAFGFSSKRSYLALIAFFLGGFVFSDFSFNIRHVVSYSLLFLAAFLAKQKKPLQAGIALGLGTFVQTPVFLMFIALLPIILENKRELLDSIKALAVGGIIALAFFLPTLLKYGLPNQAEYNVWGYMWAIPAYGFFLDYLPLVALIALFVVPALITRESKFSSFSKRALLFLAIFIIIQLTVSYRINVVATAAFALFVGLLFPKSFLEDRQRSYALGVLFGVTFSLMFLITIAFYPVVDSAQNAYSFVRENTSTEANFLNEPTLGHSFIFLAERKCTADLAVEYADEAMIQDSFEFIKEEDPKILEKYGIDYVVSRSIFLDQNPVGSNLWHELLEYEELDKIYANGIFFVHWNGRGGSAS